LLPPTVVGSEISGSVLWPREEKRERASNRQRISLLIGGRGERTRAGWGGVAYKYLGG